GSATRRSDPRSLHDALPISSSSTARSARPCAGQRLLLEALHEVPRGLGPGPGAGPTAEPGPGAGGDVPVAGPSPGRGAPPRLGRSEEHTSELQSRENLVCRL